MTPAWVTHLVKLPLPTVPLVLFYQHTKGLSKWAGMAKVMEEYGINPHGDLPVTDKEGFTKVKNKNKKKNSRS
jgi:hypothetical protein